VICYRLEAEATQHGYALIFFSLDLVGRTAFPLAISRLVWQFMRVAQPPQCLLCSVRLQLARGPLILCPRFIWFHLRKGQSSSCSCHSRRRFLRRALLYTHIVLFARTLLVLVGIQQLGREPDLATSGLLVALVACYTLLLAAVAVLVIRIGQVWDDARTILLVIVLLLFMLSTSLDFHLLFTLEAPWPGTWLLTAGLVFSVLLSEGLLSVLQIRLPLRYRGPYYLMLLLALRLSRRSAG
jgi:hypothetical protein